MAVAITAAVVGREAEAGPPCHQDVDTQETG